MALETVPKDLRHLRACLLCSLVKTIDQFEYDGCDNCDAYLQMKGNREMVYDCTSSSFDGEEKNTGQKDVDMEPLLPTHECAHSERYDCEGQKIFFWHLHPCLPPDQSVGPKIIAMMSPEDSWVSKWQRVSNFKPGVYAVSVTGRLPQGIVRELKSRGVAYKSRDTAIKT